jgi:hypothetical protein
MFPQPSHPYCSSKASASALLSAAPQLSMPQATPNPLVERTERKDSTDWSVIRPIQGTQARRLALPRQSPSFRGRGCAMGMRPNQGCGLEERRNLDQAMCLFERSEFAH